MGKMFRSLIVWTSLVAVMASGLVPGNFFILCLTPGGQISLEAGYIGTPCGGCPEIQTSSRSGVPETARLNPNDFDCPCVDLPVGAPNGQCEKQSLPSIGKFQGIPVLCSAPAHLGLSPSTKRDFLYLPPESASHSLLQAQVRSVIFLV